MTLRALIPFSGVAVTASALLLTVACGGSPEVAAPGGATAPPATSATGSPAAATTPTIIEPAEGSSSGHISLFRWSAVEGADGYQIRLNASTDRRLVWESPVLTETETELPNTVALEPEGYVWQVTALKGGAVLAQSPQSRFTVTP